MNYRNIDISNLTLTTERLTLRPWQERDLDDFFAYASVDGVGQMAGWAPHQTKEESAKILDQFIRGRKIFALDYQGKVIGSLGIEKYKEENYPELQHLRGRELGFVLAKDYWGQGLMPEAIQVVMRYLFEDLQLDFLLCGHFPENTQSARVQEKCGFVPYKELPYINKMGQKTTTMMSICKNPNQTSAR